MACRAVSGISPPELHSGAPGSSLSLWPCRCGHVVAARGVSGSRSGKGREAFPLITMLGSRCRPWARARLGPLCVQTMVQFQARPTQSRTAASAHQSANPSHRSNRTRATLGPQLVELIVSSGFAPKLACLSLDLQVDTMPFLLNQSDSASMNAIQKLSVGHCTDLERVAISSTARSSIGHSC